MVKVAVIGVIAIFLAMSLKSDKQEFAMLVILAASLIILGLALSKIDDVLSVIHSSVSTVFTRSSFCSG